MRTSTMIILLLPLQILVNLLPAQPNAHAPFMHFKNISGNRGLPGEWARCIFQDSRGLMWFGTDIGFKYYDGYGFKDYFLAEDNIIVTAMTEDHFGNIWAFASGEV